MTSRSMVSYARSVLLRALYVVFLFSFASYQSATSQLKLINDINPGVSSSIPKNFTIFGTSLLLTSNYGLWTYDGNSAAEIGDNLSFSSMAVLGDTLFLHRWHGGLYTYDGSGVNQVFQINSSISSIAADFEMVTLNGELFVVYQKDSMGCEILKYNGTDTTTITNFNLRQADLGAFSFVNIKCLTAFRGSLYFLSYNGSNTSLYKYTTGIGTQSIAIVNPTDEFGFLNMERSIATLGDTLFLSANLGTVGLELHSYDGDTLALVFDINPGNGSSSPTWLVAYEGRLYFNAYTAAPGPNQYRNKLYRYDPVEDSVTVVDFSLPDISTNPNPVEMTVLAQYLFFSSLNTSGTGYKLCRYDGNEIVRESSTDSISNAQHIISVGPRLVFSANDGMHGVEPWEYTPSELSHVTDLVSIPKKFILYQNFPNPFNPNTTIQFLLPHSADMTITVFNILGQEVSTIVSKTMSPGIHTVEWNAQGLPSGVYICRMNAGFITQTTKMLLVR